MSLSTSEDYTPHSGNERVIDLDHLDDLPLNVKQDDKDVLGDFDILHKQLDPEERKSAVVHDFSAYKKPTEIIEGPVSESIDGLDIEDLRTKINSNLEDNNFDAAYNIIQKIDSESVLHAVLSEAITFLIRKKEFSVAKKFVRLIHNMDVYTTELNYILEKERNTDPLSDFKSQNDEVVVNKIEIKKPKKEVEPVFANTEKGSISDINERTIDETNEELISDEDYDNFVKKGDVSGDILVNIADRMARGEKTTERELAIYQTFGPKIELLLRNRKGDKEAVVEGETVETEDSHEVVPSVPEVSSSIENTEKLEKDLEDSRKEFVAQEAVWRAKNQQSKSWFRKNVLGNLGMDKQTPLIPEQSELEEARIVYNLAKKNKLRETIGMGDITVLLEETERERKTLESLKSSYSPKVIKESQLNRDIRTGFLGLNSKEEDGVVYEVEKGVFAEKFESMSQKAMDKWSKLPKPVQIATSTALVTGTSFTFGLAAAAGPLGYAGYRVAKSALFGGVVAQPLGKFVDNIHNRKNKASEEESLEEFSEGINIDNFEEKEAERMARDEKMVDEKKKQRFVKAMTKVAAGGIVSAGMEMSGASSLLFDKGDIDLPGKGTLNVPNDFGDVDKNLDKLEKFRLNAKEVLPTDDKLDNLQEFKPAVSSNLDTTQVVNEAPSDLIIQDIHNLKAQIMSQYGGEVPDSLKPIMEKTPKELIKIFDFNNPGNTDFKPGVDTEDLTIDSNGNVYYVHQDGSRQTLFDSQKGKFYRFDGTEAEKTISSIGTDGSEIYPNGQIGDKVYSKLDFGGNKILTPDPVVQTVGTEVLEGDPIFKTEAVSVLDVKDTTEEEVANNTVSHTELSQGKSVDVFRMGEDKIVSYDGARIGQEVLQNGKKTLVLDDTYQDGEQYRSTREAFSKAFEANATVENVGTNPIAESFEGGKIYITYNIPNDPNSVRVYLNGKEIAVGDTTVVDSKGIPKIKMHGNLKGGWFLVDNAYERAFKHIDKLIKAGTFNFKN
ncbi:MAG TPA: hypothetical protein PLZ99_00265 [Parcubacteria group bacterium]|nr:hypothetical protein [Parcubacteria group bacterium]